MKFIPVASDFMSESEIAEIVEKNRARLAAKGYEEIDETQRFAAERLAYFVLTGGTEKQVLQYEISRDDDQEVVLIANSQNNSLAACMEILARLNQLGKFGRIDMFGVDELPQIKNTQENLSLDLDSARIGVIGNPSDWLVASSHGADLVKEKCNADLIEISMNEFIGLFLSQQQSDPKIIEDLRQRAGKIAEPDQQDLEKNVKVYLVLQNLIEHYKLDALTIRCFDLVKALQTTGCFALSKLNDEGIIAGCEGDITAVLAMLWSYRKSGKIPWMANPSGIDLKENSLALAHCTVPRTLVDSYDLRSHFESGLGVGIQGFFPTGIKVNLLRIGGEELDKIWQAEGELIATGCDEKLCRTQIKVKLLNKNVSELLQNPLGNHLVLELI
ncbi:MAG: hypothetical protein R6U84_02775 [Candidatus Cloacimonadales bacterium]